MALRSGLLSFCIGTGMMILPSFSQDDGSAAALALIGVEHNSSGIQIVARALGLSAGTYHGEMTIDRRGSGGTVSTSQASDVVLAKGESADIARVGVSYSAGDMLTVTLVLSRDGSAVSKSTLTTGNN